MASFKLDEYNQSALFFDAQRNQMYSRIATLGEQGRWKTCLLALPAAFASVGLDTIQLVSFVAEGVIKSLANIFGSLLFKQCNASLGISFFLYVAQASALDVASGIGNAFFVFEKTLLDPRSLKSATLCPLSISALV